MLFPCPCEEVLVPNAGDLPNKPSKLGRASMLAREASMDARSCSQAISSKKKLSFCEIQTGGSVTEDFSRE